MTLETIINLNICIIKQKFPVKFFPIFLLLKLIFKIFVCNRFLRTHVNIYIFISYFIKVILMLYNPLVQNMILNI